MLRQHAAQLNAATEDFERIQSKLTDLYEQDKKRAYKEQVFPSETLVLTAVLYGVSYRFLAFSVD